MNKVWSLDEADLPKELHYLRDIFLVKKERVPQPRGDRKPTESLHDYLTRKNISCFCRSCNAERKAKLTEANATLV